MSAVNVQYVCLCVSVCFVFDICLLFFFVFFLIVALSAAGLLSGVLHCFKERGDLQERVVLEVEVIRGLSVVVSV